jgi:uncharacterized protein (TIGR00730 family)
MIESKESRMDEPVRPPQGPKPTKAYHDMRFLNSSDARVVRILSEYLEPASRLRWQRVHDTIVFFGSARAELNTKLAHYYDHAAELARLVTTWTRTLHGDLKRLMVCSGGGPGIMEAANRGAQEAGGQSIGLSISLPFEQKVNPFVPEELAFEFHYFFMRKFWFVYLAKALVIFPGGFGTMDEFYDSATLVQTEKIHRLPIVLMGKDFWSGELKWVRETMLGRFEHISPRDLDQFFLTDSPAEAVRYICEHLAPRDREPVAAFQKWDTPEGKVIP